MATGSVYRHFPSKGDLFAEVFRRAAQREVDVLISMTDLHEPVTHRLAAWVEAFVRRALAEPVRAYALIAEPVEPDIDRARAAGKVRQEFTVHDMPALMCGLSATMGHPALDWRRHLELLLAGVRAGD